MIALHSWLLILNKLNKEVFFAYLLLFIVPLLVVYLHYNFSWQATFQCIRPEQTMSSNFQILCNVWNNLKTSTSVLKSNAQLLRWLLWVQDDKYTNKFTEEKEKSNLKSRRRETRETLNGTEKKEKKSHRLQIDDVCTA